MMMQPKETVLEDLGVLGDKIKIDEKINILYIENKVIYLSDRETQVLAIILRDKRNGKALSTFEENKDLTKRNLSIIVHRLNEKIKPYLKVVSKYKKGYTLLD